jgi:hypothetical protein
VATPKQGIPPAPPPPVPPPAPVAPAPDPNAGLNLYGQPSYPALNKNPDDGGNLPGEGPQPNMAPPTPELDGIHDNTRAEMEAGRKNLKHHTQRDDEEHAYGQKVLQQHAKKLPTE